MFNLDDYFAKRAGAQALNEVNNAENKLERIESAREQKITALTEFNKEKESAQRLAAIRNEQQSWAGQLGLNAQGVVGGTVNLGASLISGASRDIGSIAALPFDYQSIDKLSSVPENVREAWSRVVQGQASPEDVRLVDAPSEASGYSPDKSRQPFLQQDRPTYRQLIEDSIKAEDRANAINKFFDVSGIVSTESRDRLADNADDTFTPAFERAKAGWDASDKFEMAAGIGEILANVPETILDNKQAVTEYIAENVPSLAMGLLGRGGRALLASTNIGYATEQYREAVAEYRKANNGADPTAEERRTLGLQAASLALAEQAGDIVQIGAVKPLVNAVKRQGRVTPGDTQSFKAALGMGAAKLTGNTVGTGISEGATEVYQEYTEGQMKNDPKTAEELNLAGIIGVGAGTGIAVPGQALSTAGDLAQSAAQAMAQTPGATSATKARDATFTAAVESNDPSAYLDPQTKTFDPVRAIEVLHAHAVKTDTPVEVRTQNIEKATEIVSLLENEKTRQENSIKLRSPETLANLQVRRDALIAELETLSEDAQEQRDTLNDQIGQVDAVLAQGPLPAEALSRAQKSIEALDKDIQSAQRTRDLIQAEVSAQTLPEDLVTQIEQANTPVAQASPEVQAQANAATSSIIQLAISAPHRLSVEQVTALVENTENGLTTAQRAFLRTFTQARIASNKLKTDDRVHQNILNGEAQSKGSPGFIGLNQHSQRIGVEISGGNQARATEALDALLAFSQDQSQKLRTVQQAFNQSKGIQGDVIVVRDKAGNWGTTTDTFTDEGLREVGGLRIHANSGKLVRSIAQGVAAIKATEAQMQSAYDLRFAPTAPTTDTEVELNTVESAPVQAAPVSSVEAEVTVEPETQLTESTQEAQLPESTEETLSPNGEYTDSTENSVPVSEDITESDLVDQEPEPQVIEESPPEAETESVPESGQLNVFTQPFDKGAPYQAQNLVARYFTQTATKFRGLTSRPLVMVKDFLSHLTDKWQIATEYLSEKQKDLSFEQQDLLSLFVRKASAWNATLDGVLKKRDEAKQAYNYKDLMQFLLETQEVDGQEVVSLEENVKTAISAAVFTWLLEARTDSLLNTKEAINRMLQRDKDHVVTPDEMRAFGQGVTQHLLIDDLGLRAYQALGLRARKDAPVDLEAKLRSGLGAYALRLMTERQMLKERLTNTALLLDAFGGNKQDLKKGETFKLYFLDMDEKTLRPKAGSEVAQIFDYAPGTQNVIQNLFGVERSVSTPSFEPITELQKTANNSKQGIPQALQDAIAKLNQTPHYLRSDMLNLLSGLSPQVQEALGGVTDVSGSNTHVDDLLGKQAANDALKREMANLLEFYDELRQRDDDLSTQAFYLRHVAWKNGRVGIDATINPQGSKIHRYAVTHSDWETEVSSTDPGLMESFKLRVAEGFGIATDKLETADALAKLEGITASDEFKQAVEVLRHQMWEGVELTPDQQQNLVEVVAMGGEKFKTLDALMAWANYTQAQVNAQGEPFTFKTVIMAERDGVANGPVLSQLLLGAATSPEALLNILRMGGFYTADDAVNQFNQWRGRPGNLDLYEQTAKSIFEAVQDYLGSQDAKKQETLQSTYKDLWAIGGEFFLADTHGVSKDARQRVKELLNPLFFGSGLNKAVGAMAESFLEGYKKALIQDVAQGTNTHKAKLDALNRLLSYGGSPELQLPTNKTAQELLMVSFTEAQRNKFNKVFMNTLGRRVKDAVIKDFGVYLENRDALTAATNLTYTIYEATYKGVREEYLAELVEQGQVALNELNQPMHDLTYAQVTELNRRVNQVFPVLNTYYSSQEGKAANGIHLSDAGRAISMDAHYVSEVAIDSEQTGTQTITARGITSVMQSPGVRSVSAATHSSDGAISLITIAEQASSLLNLHDSHGGGLATALQDTQAINKNVLQVMSHYSPLDEAAKSMLRTIQGLVRLLGRYGESPTILKQSVARQVIAEAAKHYLRSLKEAGAGDLANTAPTTGELVSFLQTQYAALKGRAVLADTTKLEALKRVAVIGQYAMDNGSYSLTDVDKDSIENAQASLSFIAEPSELKELTQILSDELASAEASMISQWETFVEEQQRPKDEPTVQGPKHPKGTPAWDTYGALEVATLSKGAILQLLRSTISSVNPGSLLYTQLASVYNELMFKGAKSLQDAISKVFGSVQDGIKFTAALHQEYMNIPKDIWDDEVTTSTPGAQHDSVLTRLLNSRDEFQANDLLEKLKNRLLRKDTDLNKHVPERMRSFYRVLMKQLAVELNRNAVRVVVVTPTTDPTTIVGKLPLKQHNAWYVDNGKGDRVIYVKSDAYKHSAITPETLLHEMVHAVLARKIQDALANPQANPEVTALVNELEAMRVAGQSFVQENSPGPRYDAALENIQEFVAYGMTNAAFQNNVLSRLNVPNPANKANPLVKAMGRFVAALTGIFFNGRPRAAQINGMGIFLENVAGLFESVNQDAEQQVQRHQNIQLANTTLGTTPIEDFSAEQVFEALYRPGQNSTGFINHLASVVRSVGLSVSGPFGALKAKVAAQVPQTALDLYTEALVSGQMPFVESASQSGLRVSDQESFVIEQIEQVMQVALADPEVTTTQNYRELQRLYTEAKAKLKPSDFDQGDPVQAQATYDFIFSLVQGKNGLDYLSRFAAMGIAHEQFNALLKTATEPRRSNLSQPLGQRLQNIYYRILEWLTEKATRTYAGQDADAKLNQLVANLVRTEVRKKAALALNKESWLDALDKKLADTGGIGANVLARVSQSNLVQSSNNSFVKAVGATADVLANDRVEGVLRAVRKARDRVHKEVPGILMGTVNYVAGAPAKAQAWLRFAKKNEGDRKRIIDTIARDVLESFVNNGAHITDTMKAALTSTFLRTGAYSLWNALGQQRLGQLLTSNAQIDQEIAQIKQRLAQGYPHLQHFFDKQAHALGYSLIHGGSSLKADLLRNTHNISRLLGTHLQDSLTPTQAKAVAAELDVLVSLYALKYVPMPERNQAAQLFTQESQRSDQGNGVEAILKMHQYLLQDAKDTLFKDQAVLVQQYYLPEVYNPRIDMVVSTQAQAAELLAQGYKRVAELPKDPLDPDQTPKFIYTLTDGGLVPRVSGALSYTDTHAKGQLISDSFGVVNQGHAQRIHQQRQREMRKLFIADPGFDPTKAGNASLVPVFNPAGEIVNYTYLMARQTKDSVLQRDNRFEHLLGKLGGTTFDKQSTPKQNRAVIEALRQVYVEEYSTRPDSFLELSPTSQNPRLREQYHLLPTSTKQAIREVFGTDALQVPTEMMDILFGYAEYSIYDAFKKPAHARNRWEHALVLASEIMLEMLGHLKGMSSADAKVFSKQAGIKLRKTELILQELSMAFKDNIVIKSVTVLAGNIYSNLSLLFLGGVPLRDMIEGHKVAYRATQEYLRDSKELAILERRLGNGYLEGQDRASVEARIIVLMDQLAKNPVKPMIDDGLMPTIVEDIALDEDIYSYKSLLQEKLDKFTARVPSQVHWLARQALMTHDTQPYKLLSTLTQMSDFTSRYVLHKHLTTRKQNPLTREEANQRAMDAFVFYDIPLPKGLQYIDKMAFIPFLKYFLSIQRVIFSLVKEKPARALVTALSHNFLDLAPSIMESSVLNRVGSNPLQPGALMYPGSVADIATIQAGLSVFK